MPTQSSFEESSLGLLIFGLVFFLFAIGLAFTLLQFIREGIKGRRSRHWSVTSGTVRTASVQSRVMNSRYGRNVSYIPKIEYEYVVADQRYCRHVVRHGIGYVRNQASAQRIVNQFPKGRTIQVYYDPLNPGDAVLLRKSTIITWLLAGAVVVLIVFLLWAALGTIVTAFSAH